MEVKILLLSENRKKILSRRPNIPRFLKPQHLDSILAQDKFLHFAASRHGIGRDELEVARNLLTADLSVAVLAQFFLRKLHALFGEDHCKQFFTIEFVGHAQHLHISYLGMANEEFFNLTREDVLASANDHLFEKTHDINVASRIHSRQIAGMQPAI